MTIRTSPFFATKIILTSIQMVGLILFINERIVCGTHENYYVSSCYSTIGRVIFPTSLSILSANLSLSRVGEIVFTLLVNLVFLLLVWSIKILQPAAWNKVALFVLSYLGFSVLVYILASYFVFAGPGWSLR